MIGYFASIMATKQLAITNKGTPKMQEARNEEFPPCEASLGRLKNEKLRTLLRGLLLIHYSETNLSQKISTGELLK